MGATVLPNSAGALSLRQVAGVPSGGLLLIAGRLRVSAFTAPMNSASGFGCLAGRGLYVPKIPRD
jgi:hypothetical protein